MRKHDDIRLLQQAIACFDDVQAYKQLFTLFYPSLLSFAVTILRSKEIAEEIVSDVFIRIWQKRHQLDKVDNLNFYLFTAVRNRAYTHLQEQKKISTLNIESAGIELKSIYYDPEQKLISEENITQLRLIIQKLPPRCQLIFKLIKEDGLKYKEVAELLHLSVKTIENQMSLAFKKISSAMGNSYQHVVPSLFSEN